ncbi:MAG: nucleoside hydrolase [Actinobacteria bacterium]|nr:nucleoside hydrolase [Actinomycetota bacterium]
MTRARIAALALVVLGAALVPASASFGATSSGDRAHNDEHTGPASPHIIIDTDLSLWWDDATALGIANVLDQQGRIRLLGVMSDVRNPVAVAAINAINTAYGHGRIPIGAVSGTDANTAAHGYSDLVASKLPHRVRDDHDVPNAVSLYRRLLARQPDHSVAIVSIGGYTNIAGLLDSSRGDGSRLSGRALIAKKVKRLVIMDGIFPGGGPAFTNQLIDLAAASDLVRGNWPTPIAWVDGLAGVATKVGGNLCTTAPPNHPMRIVYEALFKCGPPGDGDWDAPTLLYAINDLPGVFTELGQGGAAVINAQGGLSWQANSTRRDDLYVHVADQQRLNARIDQLLPLGLDTRCASPDRRGDARRDHADTDALRCATSGSR